MMKSNLTTYPTAYASPFSGSCLLQQVATPPPLTHAFLGKIGLKQKCDLKLNTVKTILLCTLLALGVMQARGAAMTEENTNHSSAMAAFKEYVVNYTLFRHLSLTGKDFNLISDKAFVYIDTIKHTLPCKLHLSVNKKGYIKDCRVEGEVCPPLVERIKKIVLNYPVRIMERNGLKTKTTTEIAIDLQLPWEGNYVFLDKGLDDLVYFLKDFSQGLVACHPSNTPNEPWARENQIYLAKLSGKLSMSFVVKENGSVGGFQRLQDSIYPNYVYETYMRWLNHRGVSEGSVNIPIIKGKVVSVLGIVDYDFDAMTMGFKCYMIKEGTHNQ